MWIANRRNAVGGPVSSFKDKGTRSVMCTIRISLWIEYGSQILHFLSCKLRSIVMAGSIIRTSLHSIRIVLNRGYCSRWGGRVLRFTGGEIYNDVNGVVNEILAFLYKMPESFDSNSVEAHSGGSETNKVIVYHEAANAYYEKGDYNNALDAYNRAIELDSNFIPAYWEAWSDLREDEQSCQC